MRNCLKEIRVARGKTQSEVARDLSINLPTYRTYEQGSRRLSDENLVRFAGYFGCSADEILGISARAPIDRATAPARDRLKSLTDAALDAMSESERLCFRKLLSDYLALSRRGQEKVAEEAEMMVRSGMYARFGRRGAFPDAGSGTDEQGVSA